MRKVYIAVALVMVAIVGFYGLAAAQQAVTVNMAAQNNSGQSGTATLTARGNQTEVVLNIGAGAAGVAQPVHIHAGRCPNPGEVRFPLTNVVDGKSTTMVNVALSDLQTGNFAINAHRSAQEVSVFVSCGDIPLAVAQPPAAQPPAQQTPAALPRTGDESWPIVSAVVVMALAILGLGFALRGHTA